jgi:hypothetical protein
MSPIRESEVLTDLDTTSAESVYFLDQLLRIDDDAVPDHAELIGREDAGGDEMDGVSLGSNHHRVAGVRTAVVPHDEVVTVREQIDDFALAFVTPLKTDDGRMTSAMDIRTHANSAWQKGDAPFPVRAARQG